MRRNRSRQDQVAAHIKSSCRNPPRRPKAPTRSTIFGRWQAANVSKWCRIPTGGRIGAMARIPVLLSVDLIGQHPRQIAILAEGDMPDDSAEMCGQKEIDEILASEMNIVRGLCQALVFRQQ